MGSPRAARHRRRRARRVREPLLQQGQANPSKDGGEHPPCAATDSCACRARPAAGRWSWRPALPGRPWRLPDLHNFRNRNWKPAQISIGIEPFRRIYDLRHTFATFALLAGISTFELSRYMGASLTMIDRHYGHLARDGREHAIRLLDDLNAPALDARGRSVDSEKRARCRTGQRNRALSGQ
jgi:hypothetical protein